MSASPCAFACYLQFPQWKSDLLVHEIATIIRRRTDTSEILLSTLGSIVSPLAKDLLSSEKCKLKRFLAAATDDFKIIGPRGIHSCVFIGSAARHELPSGAPETLLQQTTLVTMKGQTECTDVINEIREMLLISDCKYLAVGEIGMRLSPESRQWFKTQEVKLATVLEESACFVVDIALGQPKVCLAPKHGVDSDMSPARDSVSTFADLSRQSSTVSETSGSEYSSPPPSPISVLRQLFVTTDMSTLADMLAQQAPLCYED